MEDKGTYVPEARLYGMYSDRGDVYGVQIGDKVLESDQPYTITVTSPVDITLQSIDGRWTVVITGAK